VQPLTVRAYAVGKRARANRRTAGEDSHRLGRPSVASAPCYPGPPFAAPRRSRQARRGNQQEGGWLGDGQSGRHRSWSAGGLDQALQGRLGFLRQQGFGPPFGQALQYLAAFSIVLGVGTAVESWYSGRVAQELIYRTWWFTALLGILGINIFFAAAKKYPWKKHQTGFLITHLGLLTMVAGGILNSLSGIDALMPLIDTADHPTQRELREFQSQIKSGQWQRALDELASEMRARNDATVKRIVPGSVPAKAVRDRASVAPECLWRAPPKREGGSAWRQPGTANGTLSSQGGGSDGLP
jgi:hypothetical protein